MPKEKRTPKRKVFMNYDRENLSKALDAVRSKSMSVRKAAELYKVPKSTLYDRVSGKIEESAHPGRKPVLPQIIEDKIVNTVKDAARQGIGISRKQLLVRTGDLCRRFKVTPFKKLTPSKTWWEGLKKRHPELTIRRPEKLSTSRASMLNPVVVKKYMDDLGALLDDLQLKNRPNQIWNCDETGRNFEHSPVRVIAEKSSRNVVGRTSSNRTNISIMACVNASGDTMSPMFVVKGKTSASLHGFNTAAAPIGTKWTYQENGWMSDRIGEHWFTDVFLKECGEARPQILILDGHSSHESLAIIQMARENNIHILCLPPHTTHILQPLDRSVFGPFSTAYNTATSNFLTENPLNSVNKWSFPGLISTAWYSAFCRSNIVNGFRACGVYPYDPNAISPTSFEPSLPTDNGPPSKASATVTSPSDDCAATEEMITVSAPKVNSLPSVTLNDSPLTEIYVNVTDPMLSNYTVTAPAISTPTSPASMTATLTSTAVSTTDVCVQNLLNTNLETLMVSQNSISDLENTEILLNLITNAGDNLVPVSEEHCGEYSLWDKEIENMFLPVKVPKPRPNATSNRKRNTSHRLLTSDEIIKQKTELLEKKEERELKKKERELKKMKSNK